MLIWFICVIALVFIDQLSKWLAIIFLEGNEPFNILDGFLRFSYVQNRGAAFGMLSDNRWVFLVLSTLAIICLVAFMLISKPQSKLERVGLALILAGGIGNMIDRVMLGYVVDFIDFYGIWSYVFNIADSCICVGVGVIILYMILLSIEEYKAGRSAVGAADGNSSNTMPSSDTSAAASSDVAHANDDALSGGEHTACHAPKYAKTDEKTDNSIGVENNNDNNNENNNK